MTTAEKTDLVKAIVPVVIAVVSAIWAVLKWLEDRNAERAQNEKLANERLQQQKEERDRELTLEQQRLDQQQLEERHRREDKVSGLVLALSEATDPKAQIWCAIALSLYPDESLPLLIPALGHVDDETATAINLALASVGTRALPQLIRMNKVAQNVVGTRTFSDRAPRADEPVAGESPAGEPAAEGGVDESSNSKPIAKAAETSVAPRESADVVKAERLLACTRSTIAYLVLQCTAEELCKLDLEEVDLRNVNFAEAKLNSAKFRKAQLQGAVFARAKLDDSNFRGAQIEQAVFSRALLNRADWTGVHGKVRAIRTIMDGATIEQAHLRQSEFSGASLKGAKLTNSHLNKAEMPGVRMQGADISKTDFGGANLAKAVISECRAAETIFASAQLAGATLTGATLAWAKLDGVKGKQLTAVRTVFEDCTLGGADFTGGAFEHARFVRCNLGGVSFDGANLGGAEFEQCVLHSVCFSNAKLAGPRFLGQNEANADRIKIDRANWREAIFEGESESLRTAFEAAEQRQAVVESVELTT
jgi:uncharacterized protein YjbI with pentapeptide repeats